jgi:anti-sigma B factor antagonist
MKLHQQRHGAVTLLKPEGPLIEAAASEFDQAARTIMTVTLGRFVVDMSAVPFVDSAGLETLVGLTDLLESSGKALKLCGVNKTVRQVLELTEIDSLFDHFEDVNSAVRSFL